MKSDTSAVYLYFIRIIAAFEEGANFPKQMKQAN